MRTPSKLLCGTLLLILFAAVGIGGWFFVYTQDLPDISQLTRFAPTTQIVVTDSCLVSPSTAIPIEGIGKSLRDALAAAESPRSLPGQISRTLLCNPKSGMLRYHLNELRLSWRIRTHFSEQQVLTIFANRSYFGSRMTGVKNASIEFFHKDPGALNNSEAALIAGLLRSLEFYSPFTHPERALQRRNKVLERMMAQGKLSGEEGARAEAAPLGTR